MSTHPAQRMTTNTEPAAADSSSSSPPPPPVVEDPLAAHRRLMVGAPANPGEDPVALYRAAMRNVRGY